MLVHRVKFESGYVPMTATVCQIIYFRVGPIVVKNNHFVHCILIADPLPED